MNLLPADELLVWIVRIAGLLHFVTLTLACFTPIPPQWDENLARLPATHRRFAVAQNVFIGGVIAVGGLFSLVYAPELVAGTGIARGVSAAIAVWWGARFVVLHFLAIGPHLTTRWLKTGFVLLNLQCALYAVGFGWLALR